MTPEFEKDRETIAAATPTCDGWYWAKDSDDNETVVRVRKFADGLKFKTHWQSQQHGIEDWREWGITGWGPRIPNWPAALDEVDRLQGCLKISEGQTATLNDENCRISEESEQLQKRVGELEAESASHSDRADKWERLHDNRTSQANKLQAENERLRKALDDLVAAYNVAGEYSPIAWEEKLET